MELEALEDDLRDSCGSYMRRFFALLDGAVTYHAELCSYLSDLQEGLYVHCTLDGVLESNCASQLLTESMTLFGCMVLLMEHRMSGLLRERLVVAYLRYDRCFNSPNLERVCELSRRHATTPCSPGAPGSSLRSAEIISVQKPENLLRRFQFPELVVDAVITCLRNGDVYNNIRFYPDPQHRTTALSLQGGHLYVLLFYSRDLLHNGLSMREIVDRFFKDSWVVPIFLHFSVDLLVSWDAFKEAKSSLVSSLSATFIRDHSLHHHTKVSSLLADLDIHMRVVNKEYVLDNSLNLLFVIRECNYTLRWLLLHRMTIDKKARDLVICLGSTQHADEGKLLQLLMKTAKLEFVVKKLNAELLKTRKDMWYEKRHDALECIKDLSQNYLGTWAASCKFKNKSIRDWLDHLSSEVSSLNYTSIGSSGRTIHRVLSTLKDIELLHQIKENVQIKHGFSKIQKYLHDMIKVLNLNQEASSIYSVITDAKYSWGYLTYFEELLKKKISQDPSESLFLHTMFLKFQSWLDAPLQRIKQCESPDLQCVSSYYASKYAAKIFAVLDIIPAILLKISISVNCIDAEQSTHLINRINKETLEGLMQLDQQLCQAKQAAKLCMVSEGLLNMSKNFDDLIDLNLGGWLKQMIKKELVSQLQGKLKALSLNYGDIEGNLMALSNYMLSQMQRMEFLQQILHIDGCSIWEGTLTAVLEECAKREVLEFMRCMQPSTNMVKRLDHMSNLGSFFGRLLQYIVHSTDPSHSMFIEAMMGWFDAGGNELLGMRFFHLLESCVGQVGLACLDSLIHVLVKQSVEHTMKDLHTLVDVKCQEELYKLDDLLGPPISIPLMGLPPFKEMVKTLHSSWGPLVEKLATIGQLQLVRNLMSFKLRSACKIRAYTISSAVDILSSSVYLHNGRFETGNEDHNFRLFLSNIKNEQNFCGLFSPLQASYISEEPPMFLTRLLCLFSISQLPKYVLDVHLGNLTSPLKKSVSDFSAVVIGLGTLLQQFGPSHITQYIEFMIQYIRMAEAAFHPTAVTNKGSTHFSEAPKALYWVMSFCKYMDVSMDLFESCLPSSSMAILQS
uniref:WASH complex subunit strumpellin n=2 Tax=Oryza brachyantha TaxID=4533 RepID=J3LXE8_ORYBR